MGNLLTIKELFVSMAYGESPLSGQRRGGLALRAG
jgi:hypothetical protein